jgi:Tol biopolymer transport system component
VQQLSPDYELGYAFWPRFSPSGEQVAYLAEIGTFESMQYTLIVQPTTGGEARSLGVFSSAQSLSWLPDGSGLILGTGPYEARQVIRVSLADGTVNTLAEGDSPALAPLAP